MTILSGIHPRPHSRREVIRNLGIIAAASVSLAACQTTKSGGVTTSTINGTKALTLSQDISQALTATLSAPSVGAVMTPAELASAQSGLMAINTTITQLQDALPPTGSVTVTVDTSNVQNLIQSLITDAQTVLLIVQTILSALKSADYTKIDNYVSAVLSLLPLIKLAVGLASSTGVIPRYTEAEAVAICRS